MSTCGHDGWVAGCPTCEREHALALEHMPSDGSDVRSETAEHWIARDRGNTVVVAAGREDALRYYREAGWTVEGPFVPADRATALLREAQRSMTWHPCVPVGRRSRWAADVDALDITALPSHEAQ